MGGEGDAGWEDGSDPEREGVEEAPLRVTNRVPPPSAASSSISVLIFGARRGAEPLLCKSVPEFESASWARARSLFIIGYRNIRDKRTKVGINLPIFSPSATGRRLAQTDCMPPRDETAQMVRGPFGALRRLSQAQSDKNFQYTCRSCCKTK
jgi:hypothetical protein